MLERFVVRAVHVTLSLSLSQVFAPSRHLCWLPCAIKIVQEASESSTLNMKFEMFEMSWLLSTAVNLMEEFLPLLKEKSSYYYNIVNAFVISPLFDAKSLNWCLSIIEGSRRNVNCVLSVQAGSLCLFLFTFEM